MCRAIPENFSIFLVFAQKSYPPGGFLGALMTWCIIERISMFQWQIRHHQNQIKITLKPKISKLNLHSRDYFLSTSAEGESDSKNQNSK